MQSDHNGYNYHIFKGSLAYLKEQNDHFFTVFLNKFLKHVFISILKLNNQLWKKV